MKYLVFALCGYVLVCLITAVVIGGSFFSLYRHARIMYLDGVYADSILLRRSLRVGDLLTFGILKKTPVVLLETVATIGEAGVIAARNAQGYLTAALNGDEQSASLSLDALGQSVTKVSSNLSLFLVELQSHPYVYDRLTDDQKKKLQEAVDTANSMQRLIQTLPAMTGPGEKRYIVLLQNNMELRPTGGFLGSFAYVVFQNGAMKSIQVQDIYVPDGQLKGYVEAPEPLKVYLQQTGGWKLRDANWDPDLPTSAKTLAWFFEQGGYAEIDGIISVNLGVVQNVLTALGPISLPDYHETVSAENFYSLVQVETEQSFFPGATNKSDILSALSRALLRELKSLPQDKQLAVGQVLYAATKQRDLAFWLKDTETQNVFHVLQWDGATQRSVCNQQNCVADNLYIVEANLGANKTNCCVARTVTHDVWIHDDGSISKSTQLSYENNNPSTPQPPRYYGGGYANYVRIYTNPEVTPTNLSLAGMSNQLTKLRGITWDELGVHEFGFLAQVEGGEKKTFTLDLADSQKLDLTQSGVYTLLIQRQPGVRTNDYIVRIHHPEHLRITVEHPPGTIAQTSNMIELHLAVKESTSLIFTLGQ